MLNTVTRDSVEDALLNAGAQAFSAERACRGWEQGGDPEAVATTAELAICAATAALDALGDDGIAAMGSDHQSRRGRLACAAWLLLLAGADEGGASEELHQAMALFLQAADA